MLQAHVLVVAKQALLKYVVFKTIEQPAFAFSLTFETA